MGRIIFQHGYFENFKKQVSGHDAAVKVILTGEHQLYRLAFSESNVHCKWDRIIFSDDSTFSSVNDGPVLVYRQRGERYNSVFVLLVAGQFSQLVDMTSIQGLSRVVVVTGDTNADLSTLFTKLYHTHTIY
jgi:hypothetical protein